MVISRTFTGHEPALGSGQKKVLKNIAGQVGSGHEMFKISRVGSGRVGSGHFHV